MKFNRSRMVALCLGVALLVMTGSAMASTTTVYPASSTSPTPSGSTGPILFAEELGLANATWAFPGATCTPYSFVVQQMNVIRQWNSTGSSQNYWVYLQLDNGAQWTAADSGANWTFTNQGSSPLVPTATLQAPGSGIGVGTATLRYYIELRSPLTTLTPGTFTVPLANYSIRDVNNRIGPGANHGDINITVIETDGGTDVEFERSSAVFIRGSYGVSVTATYPQAGAATIDVIANRRAFITATNVFTDHDSSATIRINSSTQNVFARTGCQYELSALSSVQLIITGNFSDVSSVCIGNDPAVVGAVCATPATGATTVTLNVPGTSSLLTGGIDYINLYASSTGTAQLQAQTFTFLVQEVLAASDGTNPQTLVPAGTILTVWRLNGTVLTAVWQNGNGLIDPVTGALTGNQGRMYIWNPSSVSGEMYVQIYTLPVGLGGSTQLLPTLHLLGGPLPPLSGTNIRVPDLFTALGGAYTPPYSANGGNVVIVVTITAPNCHGWSNVFNYINGVPYSFGVTPMVETTSSSTP